MAYGQPLIQLYTSDPSIPGSTPTNYILSEHNRGPAQISYETIQQSSRMADGTMRRFITANKKGLSLSWTNLPSAGGYNFTSDSNLGGAFIKSFYEENVYNPIWIKITYSDESWRFANTQSLTNNYGTTNLTFNATNDSSASIIPSPYTMASVAFGTFVSGSSTASVYTSVPHNFTVAGTQEVSISGVNQIFNGVWRLDSTTNANVAVFRFSASSNASATFKINSYVQSGNSITINTDNTEFIKNNATFTVKNSKNVSGSSINGTWTVTGTPSSSTIFTASNTSSQAGAGFYGDATLISSSSFIKNLGDYGTIAPAVASDILKVFITDFSYTINKRYVMTDIVDISMKFTEI